MSETFPQSKLNPAEKALYESRAKGLGLTEDDFLELREIAKGAHSTGVKKFFSVGGVLMEEKLSPDEQGEVEKNVTI